MIASMPVLDVDLGSILCIVLRACQLEYSSLLVSRASRMTDSDPDVLLPITCANSCRLASRGCGKRS
jgi:hypothetical protein